MELQELLFCVLSYLASFFKHFSLLQICSSFVSIISGLFGFMVILWSRFLDLFTCKLRLVHKDGSSFFMYFTYNVCKLWFRVMHIVSLICVFEDGWYVSTWK